MNALPETIEPEEQKESVEVEPDFIGVSTRGNETAERDFLPVCERVDETTNEQTPGTEDDTEEGLPLAAEEVEPEGPETPTPEASRHPVVFTSPHALSDDLNAKFAHRQADLRAARIALGLAVLRGEPTDEAHDALAECEERLLEVQCAIEAFPTYQQQEQARAEQRRLEARTTGPTNAEKRAAYDDAISIFLKAMYNERPSPEMKIELAAHLLRAGKATGQLRTNDALSHIRANRIDLSLVQRAMNAVRRAERI